MKKVLILGLICCMLLSGCSKPNRGEMYAEARGIKGNSEVQAKAATPTDTPIPTESAPLFSYTGVIEPALKECLGATESLTVGFTNNNDGMKDVVNFRIVVNHPATDNITNDTVSSIRSALESQEYPNSTVTGKLYILQNDDICLNNTYLAVQDIETVLSRGDGSCYIVDIAFDAFTNSPVNVTSPVYIKPSEEEIGAQAKEVVQSAYPDLGELGEPRYNSDIITYPIGDSDETIRVRYNFDEQTNTLSFRSNYYPKKYKEELTGIIVDMVNGFNIDAANLIFFEEDLSFFDVGSGDSDSVECVDDLLHSEACLELGYRVIVETNEPCDKSVQNNFASYLRSYKSRWHYNNVVFGGYFVYDNGNIGGDTFSETYMLAGSDYKFEYKG